MDKPTDLYMLMREPVAKASRMDDETRRNAMKATSALVRHLDSQERMDLMLLLHNVQVEPKLEDDTELNEFFES